MKEIINNELINTTSAMLKLIDIKKDYFVSGNIEPVRALKGITINFRENEFVSILGPSGCGKTTLLNIIGGLDKYTEGDLVIDGVSTKKYKDRDWDIYRNHRIGFIFQSYNLIPHQTILENVELALTISGVSKQERIAKSKKALDRVGLEGLYNQKPNQLSGGQCQRVAIARALVNEPDILLADEPTGALDTTTSKQIMDLISDISKEKLVIMVTHNPEIAEQYSTRIIRLVDGLVVDDTNPFVEKNTVKAKIRNKEKAKMSFLTAFKLSFRNLISKFKRTILVCIAGSIGIVGVSTVLAVSSGIHGYIDSMQDDMLSGNPVTIKEKAFDISTMVSESSKMQQAEIIIEHGVVNVNSIIEYLSKQASAMESFQVTNNINQDYIDFVMNMPTENYSAITLDYGFDVSNNIYTDWKFNRVGASEKLSIAGITKMYTSILKKTDFANYSSYISQLDVALRQAPNNTDYILSQYDVLAGEIAKEENEIMVVLNKNSQVTDIVLGQLGYYTQEEFINIVYRAFNDPLYNQEFDKNTFAYDEVLNKTLTWYPNDEIFAKNENSMFAEFNPFTYKHKVDDTFENGIDLKVTGILQAKDDISYGCLDAGFYYTEALSKKILEKNLNSEIIKHYKDKNLTDITSGPYPNQQTGVTIPSGVTFTYDYVYENETFTELGYLGNESNMSALMSFIQGVTGNQNASKNSFYSVTLRQLGGVDVANSISIYPLNFENKYKVTDYLDKWNDKEEVININGNELKIEDREKITYTDNLEIIIAMINTMIDIITYALIVFTALSLLVSTVMIGIITYVSVVERVKEIGVIRSLGGRKKDVSHLFNAETFIIGLSSGIIGILITLGLSAIINLIVGHFANIYTIAALQPTQAIIMISISVLLTLISGLIPAKAAANKNPVEALRTE